MKLLFWSLLLSPPLSPSHFHSPNTHSDIHIPSSCFHFRERMSPRPVLLSNPLASLRVLSERFLLPCMPCIFLQLQFHKSHQICFLILQLYKAGFKEPTAIQAQAWPIAMQGKDIIAVAKTGSGKTLGFLIPGFLCLKRLRRDPKSGPTVLVLSPTRELATQIQDEAVKFGGPAKIATTVCIYLFIAS